jgi:hypothetical protein
MAEVFSEKKIISSNIMCGKKAKALYDMDQSEENER